MGNGLCGGYDGNPQRIEEVSKKPLTFVEKTATNLRSVSMSNNAENYVKFEMGNIAPDSISDEELSQSDARPLTRAGEYDFTLVRATFAKELKKDAAGKRWHGVFIQGETNIEGNAYRSSIFLNVPVDDVWHTTADGKKSKYRLNQVKSLLSSIIGEEITTTVSLLNHIEDIQSVLKIGEAQFRAVVGASGDRVTFTGNDDVKEYKIALKKGGYMLNDMGEEMVFATREAASEAYQQIKNFKPKQGLEITKFLPRG